MGFEQSHAGAFPAGKQSIEDGCGIFRTEVFPAVEYGGQFLASRGAESGRTQWRSETNVDSVVADRGHLFADLERTLFERGFFLINVYRQYVQQKS